MTQREDMAFSSSLETLHGGSTVSIRTEKAHSKAGPALRTFLMKLIVP